MATILKRMIVTFTNKLLCLICFRYNLYRILNFISVSLFSIELRSIFDKPLTVRHTRNYGFHDKHSTNVFLILSCWITLSIISHLL